MPVSTSAKRCKHCEESGHRLDSGGLFWRIQLDQDLLDTIVAIYPEWFKDYNLNRSSTMAEGGSGGPGPTAPESAAGGGTTSSSQGLIPLSPPKAEVDESPLQKSMDKNKESLKVKLMMRRPINQLVAQGIMPPLKTPPAFHEQRQKLERAKMGDLLKAKIQQRPNRQDLVNQHILEQDGHVDPSLAERQRMLKKARLADSLNDQLSHRPGPLELIKKNILHTEEPIERAVKEGVIPFKATSEGQLTKPQHPNHYITFDDDSQSSEGAASPPASETHSHGQTDVLEAAAASAGIVTVSLTLPASDTQTVTFADLCGNVVSLPVGPAPSPLSLTSTTSSLSPMSSISSPPAVPAPSPTLSVAPRPMSLPSPLPSISQRTDAPGKDKNRKKSKSKSTPKARTIKFHEYKGPPNAHKNSSANASPVETSYELLLQQQQLFLQWQLEWQHKYPQIILPAAQKPIQVSTSENPGILTVTSVPSQPPPTPSPQQYVAPSPSPAPPPPPPTPTPQPQPAQEQNQSLSLGKTLGKLEDMKVSDLKAELKRRNLPVSGSKPQLIERLKPFSERQQTTDTSSSQNSQDAQSALSEDSVSGLAMDTPVSPPNRQTSPEVEESVADDDVGLAEYSPVSHTMSPEAVSELDMETCDVNENLPSPSPPSHVTVAVDVIRDQQRKIEELQRELLRSQLQLQQIRHANLRPKQQQPAQQPVQINGVVIDLAKHNQKLALQQHLQNKIQQQQLQVHLQQLQNLQQQQHIVFQQQLQQQQQHQKQLIQQQKQQQQQQMQQKQQQQQQQQQQQVQQKQQQQLQQQLNQQPQPQIIQQQPQIIHHQLPIQHQHILKINPKRCNIITQSPSVKANLAAFLQTQNQQQQINALLQQQVATNNKLNLKKNLLGQHQAAIVLNHINQQKLANGHQRAASLPDFFGAFVTNRERVKTETEPPPAAATTLVSSPQYEESPKQVQVKEESSASGQKNVKSQIVDDVLEILIKNGELPPSAAQDPTTPTTPGRNLPQGPEFTAVSPVASPPTPPPPPPPPLPCTTFAITLPTSIRLTTHADTPFQMQLSPDETLDFILSSVNTTPEMPQPAESQSAEPPVPMNDASEFPPNRVDLKELGLDLESFDSMDFGQLDCGDISASIKNEPSNVITDMEVGGIMEPIQKTDLDGDHLMDNQDFGSGNELMDISMDMDDSDWLLDSLMPSTSSDHSSDLSSSNPSFNTSFDHSLGYVAPPPVDQDLYDPLLSNGLDHFDLFNLEDSVLSLN